MNNILGDYIGFDESKLVEFKEFILKNDPSSYFDEDEIINMVKTGILVENFNDIIVSNLHHYFKFYLPKYISAFGNLIDAEKYGYLYIGINDIGEITGIPFVGELEKEYIEDMISSIKIFINAKNTDELLSNIEIEVIKINIDSEFLSDPIRDILEVHEEKYSNYKQIYRKFLQNQRIYVDKINTFNIKMSTFITDRSYRDDISKYIRDKTDNPIYLELAKKLDSDHKFKILDGIEISEQKNDKTNIYHWITSYKDECIDDIMKSKPSKPSVQTIHKYDIYENQFQMLTNLRLRFIEKNTNLNYYVLKINLPTNNQYHISYSNLGVQPKWYSKVRDVVNGNPCCI